MRAPAALTTIALLLLLASCVPSTVAPDSGPPLADAALPDASGCAQPGPADNCAAAGERLCQLRCRGALAIPLWVSPMGTPYAEVCRRAFADGRDWRPDCVRRITSCDQFDAAYRAHGSCQ